MKPLPIIATGLLLLGNAIVTQPAQAQADPKHAYGDDPGWTKFREVAEKAVIGRLIDPESARITWLSGYRKGGFKPIFQGRVFGYVACGTVNARNRMGGYGGATGFIVVVDYDRALFVEMDQRTGGMYYEMCAKEIAEGKFPPVPVAARVNVSPSTPSDTEHAGGVGASSPAGLTVRAMPEGAYIAAVQPGSIAAAAGLSPGMVITSLNAIPLAGMGEAMTRVVAAAGSGTKFELIGGKAATLGGSK